MNKKDHMIWMPLIGFDRDRQDKGVGEYLDSIGFIPSVMSAFIFHPDIINQHENMDKEFTFHIDFCHYFGFAGLHVSDCFCPPGYSISNGDRIRKSQGLV